MNSKKRRIFLVISFTIFAFSIIAIIVSIIASYYRIQADFSDDNVRAMSEFAFGTFFMMLIAIPFWGVELSFIRSCYKILIHRPMGIVLMCYIVSCVSAFLAFAFQCFVSIGLVTFESFDTGNNLTAYILLFTEWLAFIVSFMLGSLPIKRNERSNEMRHGKENN